jgi:hypothetical protein
MKLSFVQMIDNEPVFEGLDGDNYFRVVFVRTDIDYGWQWLDYLPAYTQIDSGRAGLTEDVQHSIMTTLSDHDWQDYMEVAE